jgi:hypothetical protein
VAEALFARDPASSDGTVEDSSHLNVGKFTDDYLTALTAVELKLVRVIFAVWTRGTSFEVRV